MPIAANLSFRLGLADGVTTAHCDGCWIEPDWLPFLGLISLLMALYLRPKTGCRAIFRGGDLNKTRSCGHWIGRCRQFWPWIGQRLLSSYQSATARIDFPFRQIPSWFNLGANSQWISAGGGRPGSSSNEAAAFDWVRPEEFRNSRKTR